MLLVFALKGVEGVSYIKWHQAKKNVCEPQLMYELDLVGVGISYTKCPFLRLEGIIAPVHVRLRVPISIIFVHQTMLPDHLRAMEAVRVRLPVTLVGGCFRAARPLRTSVGHAA